MNSEGSLPEGVAECFAIYGELESSCLFGSGHINTTFVSRWNQAGARVRYLHQLINDRVFLEPGEVMENIDRVTRHIASVLRGEGEADISRRTLTVVPSRDGRLFVRDGGGGWWRTYLFVERAHALDVVSSPSEAFFLGKAVGRFQRQLARLEGKRLNETIPGFHNMESRYRAFRGAVERDPLNRAGTAGAEIDFMLENEERGAVLTRALTEGRVPERVCHNDAKINNILIDDGDNRALCVVDLDTVMPGTCLFDVGDLIRTVAARAKEDERDLSQVEFDFPFFTSLVEGYLSEASSFLTTGEKELLAESGRNITHIMALRFLTDYLNGDTYYRTSRPGHNLDRARNQIALVRSMDRNREKITRFLLEAV
ncbi:MAG: aminoglycoside phosphotransferase family protein [Treponema sp.]|nr:aminoglycoside phosphotransferase family protein [Treponema sp.]